MRVDNTLFHVEFYHSKETFEVGLRSLIDKTVDFLDHYGEEALVGEAFYGVVRDGDGHDKFSRLLIAAGCENNPKGFFSQLIEKLEKANSRQWQPIHINGIALPHIFLVAVLETILPGNRFISVKTVAQLEKLTNMSLPPNEREDLQSVIDTYPVRLSMHTIRQMRSAEDVAYQYLPFVEELDPVGHVNTWIGQFHQGLLEQMYQNRVIFLLNMTCPVYCRFCFRKHKESRNQENPTIRDVEKAIDYIRHSPKIKEIVITGGDPFLNKANMACAIDGLMDIPHVQTLRLATRSIAYYPHLFYANHSDWLTYLNIKNLELQRRGKRMEIATHFIHPDEISPESLEIISFFVRNGVSVYVQTPFLRGCNDEGPELTRLFNLLRGAGAELHYIYIPCSPIHGNSIYWNPLSKGIAAARYLRAHVSDRVTPRICTATPIGKIDWHTSGWAVEKDPDNDSFIWIRTPYTPGYFKEFAPLADEQNILRVNDEGTLDARYMAEIGDDALFVGARKARPEKQSETDPALLARLTKQATTDQRMPQSIVPTGSPTLYRIHETRVEIDADATEHDLAYIRKHKPITDVVISAKEDAAARLHTVGKLVSALQDIHHVNSVRIRSLNFNYAPARYTRATVEKLGTLNRLTAATPLRLEIETQFLLSKELKPIHAELAVALRNKGITVYNSTPLLTGINDAPDLIHELAYGCREIGIEFHHLYAAGLPLQESWNADHPLDVADVIDIATRVRRDGSGREIPRYMIRTRLGEVDFGLTSTLIENKGTLWIKLLPYDLPYYQSMHADFTWPEEVRVDANGIPMIPVSGLKLTDDFLVQHDALSFDG